MTVQELIDKLSVFNKKSRVHLTIQKPLYGMRGWIRIETEDFKLQVKKVVDIDTTEFDAGIEIIGH